MGTYSTNQVRQFYYMKNLIADGKTTDLKDPGDCIFKKLEDGKSFCFEYMGAEGNVMRTDIVDVDKILKYNKKASNDVSQVKVAKCAKIKLADDAITTEGNVFVGEDYIMTIVINQAFSKGDDDTYIKTIPVHAKNNMTASDFYIALAKQCVSSFVRDTNVWFKFYLGNGGTLTEVTKDNAATITGTFDSVFVIEQPQNFILGLAPEEEVYFTVTAGYVKDEAKEDDIIWGVVTTSEDASKDDDIAGLVGNERWYSYNGKRIADLEWFAMGERGDQYRMVGYPNYVPTTYLCDKDEQYDIIEIHYAYVGPGVSCQKSERDMTIVVPATKAAPKADAELNEGKAIAEAIEALL